MFGNNIDLSKDELLNNAVWSLKLQPKQYIIKMKIR